MRSLWDENAAPPTGEHLALRAYSSRLIGLDRSLVLHGGGNTSVKSETIDLFGATQRILWVKASGFDLATMGEEGFTGLLLDSVLQLGALDSLSDTNMVAELKRARIDPDAAAPSIEAIVHALVPYRYVDHTHADAVLTISNSPNGAEIMRDIYGGNVCILPYVKPGFDLALQFRGLASTGRLEDCNAIILEHHGVFTFGNDARASYEAMIEIVSRAEAYLEQETQAATATESHLAACDIARTRRAASTQARQALLSLPAGSMPPDLVDRVVEMCRHGTVTPEHVVHNKPFPARIDPASPEAGIEAFANEYRAYFKRGDDANLIMLPDYPHWALFEDGSARSFGPDIKRATVSADVAQVTVRVLLRAAQLGGWQGLEEADQRAIEYWELEQAKLKRLANVPALSGKVALVAGAASGIGRAAAELLLQRGAAVAGLDIDPSVTACLTSRAFIGFDADLREESRVREVLEEVIRRFGGLDMLVLNAGIFQTGQPIETLSDEDWDRTLSVNLSAHRKVLKQAIPFLKLGVDPAVVFIGSRNVPAPGPGAAAYSVSKAGLTQLMRVAALELAQFGIRVNAVHPDAVFDTHLWTQDALESSARRYGLSVEAYKQRNLLGTEVLSTDVAAAIVALLDGTLSRTTGAQLPVDGGNDRVI